MRYQAICIALAVSVSSGWQAAGQTLQEKLAAPSVGYSISATGSLNAFVSVAAAFKLPMGIEWIKVTRGDAPLVSRWEASSVSGVLQDVVKAYGYEFEVSNGVVHVYPAVLHADPSNVLNTRIDSFAVKDEFVNWGAHRLAGKVGTIMVPPSLRRPSGGVIGSIATGYGDKKVTFEVQNATVREVLDKLCLAADLRVWIVAYPQDAVKTRGGFLKTIPLHTSTQRDDDVYAPDWIFLPWGIRPVIAD